jgi:hypothetical protein
MLFAASDRLFRRRGEAVTKNGKNVMIITDPDNSMNAGS